MRLSPLALLLAAACAGAPVREGADFAPYASLPRPLSAPETPSLEPGEEYPIDLPTALRLAGAHHLAAAIARERADAAAARADAAKAAFLPALRPRVEFFRHEGRVQETSGDFFDVDKQSTTIGPAAEITLDFGDALFEAPAEKRRARAALAAAGSAERDAALEVVEAYTALQGARDRIGIAEAFAAHARAALDLETSRQRQGTGLEADVARARANLAEAEQGVVEARSEMRLASAALVRVLHLDPAVSLGPAEEELSLEERVPLDTPLPALLESAYASRPEIAGARARLAAAEAEREGTRIGPLLPRLRFDASYDAFGPNPGDFKDREIYRAAVEWDLDAALFPARDEADARVREAKYAFASLRDRLAEEVVSGLERARAARERLGAADARVAASEEALRLADARRRGGAALLIEVLDAQAALTRARTDRLEATLEFNRSQARLAHAVGALGPPPR